MNEPGHRTFAEKLRHLIDTVHPQDRGPYSYREIARGIEHLNGAMSHEHLRQLGSGRQQEPRRHQLAALATFFGVPVTYWFDDDVAAGVDSAIERVREWRDDEVASIAERVAVLPPEHRQAVSTMVDHLASYEPTRGRRRRRDTGISNNT